MNPFQKNQHSIHFIDPTLILPYDRGDSQWISFCKPIISPVTGEIQRGKKLIQSLLFFRDIRNKR
jgi:hypothetical protein